MARLPITTQRRDIDVRVVYGQSIFELYQQIQRLLQNETPELGHFFAEPIVNAVRGEIGWNTRAAGAIRPVSNLSAEEWRQISGRLKHNCAMINQLVGRMEQVGRGNSSGTEALKSMLMTPDLKSSLFLVGNELVLSQWGCYTFGTEAKHADLFEQIDRQPVKPVDPPEELPLVDETPPESPPLPPQDPQPPVSQAAPKPTNNKTPEHEPEKKPDDKPPPVDEPPQEPPEEEVIAKRSYLWRWLVLLLLLLLLILGILWKYWHSHGNALVEKEAALRSEITELWTGIDKKARECALISPATTDAGSAPVISDTEIDNRRTENDVNPNSTASVSLAWNDKSDLDLIVEQPDGGAVFFGPCKGSSCGTLDLDANRCTAMSGCVSGTDRPLENISWNGPMVPGKYVVIVNMYSANSMPAGLKTIPFTVRVTKDGKSAKYTGEFRPEEMRCTDLCRSHARRVAEFTIDN
jgi:hypothetical protein